MLPGGNCAVRVESQSSRATMRPYIYVHVIGPCLLGMLLHKQRCLYPTLYGLPSHTAKVPYSILGVVIRVRL